MSQTNHLVSAGGVVWRQRDGRQEVVLCGRGQPIIWGLPKGGPNPGESLEEAALREVREETGLEAALVEPLDAIEYTFWREGQRYHKKVHFFLMRPLGGNLSLHDAEFDQVQWFPLEEAPQTLTYQNETQILARAQERVKALQAGKA